MIEVKVPDIGDFKDVPVIAVLVKAGDRIEKEQSIVTLESDKATVDVPAPSAGVVGEVRVKVGDKVSEGTLLLTLEEGRASGLGPQASGTAPSPSPSPSPSPATSPSPSPSTPTSTSTSSPADCDVLVLGSGPGGYSAAFRAADLGQRVILVECIPSKALLHVAALIDEAKALSSHGISFGEP